MSDLKHGQRVRLPRFDHGQPPAARVMETDYLSGVVCGDGFVNPINRPAHEVVLVQLDQGFYDETKKHYVSILVVHPDGIEVIS